MDYSYKTRGTCSSVINFSVDENGIVSNIKYTGGCHGNLQAVARLADGMTIDEVITRLGGIRCGMKSTSCGDQLAQALIQIRDGQN